MLNAAVESFLEKNLNQVLGVRLGGAKIEMDRGSYFVFHQHDHGRAILGHGQTVKQAVDAATAYWEG